MASYMKQAQWLAVAVLVASGCASTESSKQAKELTAKSVAKSTPTSPHDKEQMLPDVPKPIPTTTDGYLDATKIDLSGTPGTTRQQRQAAEVFLSRTIKELPRWADFQTAIDDGFVTLDRGIVGVEHMMHWDWINDGRTFDPTYPESLVYAVDRTTGKRTLEAAMFFLPDGVTLDNAPTKFGSLVQFHVHADLCFVRGETTQLLGLLAPPADCPYGSERLPNAMMHAWIVPNACGPFAALEGIGGGTTKSGIKQCDHAHGSAP